jgi:cell division transport system permease protein
MTLLRTLIYFFQEALLDLRRNKALYGFAWFVMALSLFVLGFSRYITGNVNALLRAWEKDLEVRVFLEDGLDSSMLKALEQTLGKDPSVGSVEYISPEEALEVLARLAPAFQAAGSRPGESPLPPSLSLKLKAPLDLARVRALVARAAGEPGVAQVFFDWDWVDRLRVYSRFVGLLGWVLFGALGLAAVFTVAAICRIIALNRREEIVILHFVGATGSSIRGPFVAGGLMMGAMAAFGALSVLFALHLLLQRFGGSDALLLDWVSHGFLDLGDQGLLLGAGILLGALGGAVGLGSIERWAQ